MQYDVLGPLEVRDGGRVVEVRQRRQQVVLAVLLLRANELVSSDELIDALWEERAPPSAAGSLHNTISDLRRALGAARVVTRGRGYVLVLTGEELDAARFEVLMRRARAAGDPSAAAALLCEALALWRGPALAGLTHERALAEGVARLEELRLSAREELIEAELARGRHARVIPDIDALVAREPLRERLRSLQIVALYRCGVRPTRCWHTARRAGA